MSIISWLKKNKPKRCKHFKSFGEEWPENMKEIMRFSPYKTDKFGYGISECSECNQRAFSCVGVHMMGPIASGIIDQFIAHEIALPEFINFLEKNMAWHESTTHNNETQTTQK